MRPAWLHENTLNMITGHLILLRLVILQIPHLNQAVAVDDDEDLPFAQVPVLALFYSRLRDVDGYLAAIECADQLGEAAPRIAVHPVIKDGRFFGEVGQVHRKELLFKGTGR